MRPDELCRPVEDFRNDITGNRSTQERLAAECLVLPTHGVREALRSRKSLEHEDHTFAEIALLSIAASDLQQKAQLLLALALFIENFLRLTPRRLLRMIYA
jgi:hypothetical protein